MRSSSTRGRPRWPSGTGPVWIASISPSSISAAVIADTVVPLSSVRSEISTREILPKHRMVSSTWYLLISRISSGSAILTTKWFTGAARRAMARADNL